jgi:predicted nucleic acid-binding protein
VKQTYFLDTNVILYALDPRDSRKQKTANDLIRDALSTESGFISSQVVQEFCNVALGKFQKKAVAVDIERMLSGVLRRLWNHTPSIDFYQRTVLLQTENSLSFYDALIIQAAVDMNCKVLYSEDLQDGRKYGNLTVKNPFKT